MKEAWKIVDPILGNVSPLRFYEPGTWGPTEAAQLTQPFNGWDDTSAALATAATASNDERATRGG